MGTERTREQVTHDALRRLGMAAMSAAAAYGLVLLVGVGTNSGRVVLFAPVAALALFGIVASSV